MATTIRIDPDDELPAILERLPARGACILVLPPHARALNSVVGAKLLARRAQALETRVAVVSEDRAVTAHVRAASIPVAASVAEAMRLLPAPLLFDEPAPEASVVPVVPALPALEDPPQASPNGAGGDDTYDAHEAITLAHPVVEGETLLGTPREDAGADAPAPVAGSRAQTIRFVARQPAAPPSDTAPEDLAEDEEAPGPRGIRGHSGGARAVRRGNRATGAATFSAGAAGGTSGRTTDAHAPPPKGASAARPVRRPASRIGGLLASERLTRLLMPLLLGAVLLLLLLWLILSVLGGLLNPSANLTVRPRVLPITAATNPVVHTYITAPPKRRVGPYTRLYSYDTPRVEGVTTTPVNGSATLPGQTATGQISLRNPGAAPVVVPAGSAFTTRLNKQTFVTTKNVTVPGARLTFDGAEYGKAAVPIKAAAGGAAGNVPAKAIVNVLSPLGGLFVTNAAGTTGGTDRHVKVPLQSDVDAAAGKLFASLEAKARQLVAARPVEGGGGVEQHTLYVPHSPVQPRVNGTDTLATLSLSVVLHAVYVSKADLQRVARAAIGAPPNLLSNSVTYTATWRPDNSIALAPAARVAPPIDTDTLKAAIQGQSKESAKLYLDHHVATYTLDLSPGWADHVPADLSRIHINVQGPQ